MPRIHWYNLYKRALRQRIIEKLEKILFNNDYYYGDHIDATKLTDYDYLGAVYTLIDLVETYLNKINAREDIDRLVETRNAKMEKK